jgi:hypothetical protein
MFKSWSLEGQEGVIIGKTMFTCVNIEKKIFSRTSRPILIKLGSNRPWVKGIQNCSNKGPGALQRGYDKKKSKHLERSLKNALL